MKLRDSGLTVIVIVKGLRSQGLGLGVEGYELRVTGYGLLG